MSPVTEYMMKSQREETNQEQKWKRITGKSVLLIVFYF